MDVELKDTYDVYFTFQDERTHAQITELVRYFDDECEIRTRLDNPSIEDYAEKLDNLYLRIFPPETNFFSLYINSEVLGAVNLPHFRITLSDNLATISSGQESTEEAVARWDKFYTLLGELYEWFVRHDQPPVYVYGLDFVEGDYAADPDHDYYLTADQIRAGEIPGIYWLQIFPPAMVETLGREELLSAPAYRVDELTDGAVLLVRTSGIVSESRGVPAEDVDEHLGLTSE